MPNSTFRHLIVLFGLGGAVGSSVPAIAQPSAVPGAVPGGGIRSVGPSNNLGILYTPTSQVPTSPDYGVKLSESAVLHVGVTAEAGVDTNVFYSNANRIDSPVIRIIPFLQLTNQTREGNAPDGAYYNLSASLLYREYASSDERVKAQRAFNPSVSGTVEFGSLQSLGFMAGDNFSRSEEPPYGIANAQNGIIKRTYNSAFAQARWTPHGGRLSSTLRYTNSVDLFDNVELEYANSLRHDMLLDVSWRWLPKTALYVQASQGYLTYLNDNAPGSELKQDGYPFRALVGLRGLVTEKLTVNTGIGYGNAFYRGPAANPTGWGNLSAMVDAVYRLTLRLQASLGYAHEFRNSVIGNFYDVDGVHGALRYALSNQFVASVFSRYEYRRYHGAGAEGRRDFALQGGASADYFIQRWFYVGLFYVYAGNRAKLAGESALTPLGQQAAGLEYDKHMVLGHVGVTY